MRKRRNQILIRLDDDEFEKLKERIEKSKLSQADFTRSILLNKKIIVFENTREFLTELKRIGNNLNQLARAVNMGKTNCGAEFAILVKEVRALWQSLKSLKGEKV